ncbi:uncharacterized protein BDR25DRAFT_356953 [Lindgomyces ingoldianus]|uniref:Uncharacterized protein n=1 Tax=Lindgomyces ingoldianus TaxID=673940 RepID=A0ACB6QSW8_9PLEO|nr:uncharacterized protein BDR25DRAFT_356953 [Lindgomyces ingoldianus]KAF2469177.1 hypothetical protein BDR25DRAFT_356953 [Lindgomyces ingoldianus]
MRSIQRGLMRRIAAEPNLTLSPFLSSFLKVKDGGKVRELVKQVTKHTITPFLHSFAVAKLAQSSRRWLSPAFANFFCSTWPLSAPFGSALARLGSPTPFQPPSAQYMVGLSIAKRLQSPAACACFSLRKMDSLVRSRPLSTTPVAVQSSSPERARNLLESFRVWLEEPASAKRGPREPKSDLPAQQGNHQVGLVHDSPFGLGNVGSDRRIVISNYGLLPLQQQALKPHVVLANTQALTWKQFWSSCMQWRYLLK